tara:strand:+ start:16 stop:213 length:198 start_codon:yes stop_codon:yes gene_type:complete
MAGPFKLDKSKFNFGNKGKFNFKKRNKYVDLDAPGIPGKPGYEPPVRRSDLDEKGKKLYDKLRKK